eukprot:2232488-Pyramimonas_sp.AAC.1
MSILSWGWVDPIRPADGVRSLDRGEPRESTSRQHPVLAVCQRRHHDSGHMWQEPCHIAQFIGIKLHSVQCTCDRVGQAWVNDLYL